MGKTDLTTDEARLNVLVAAFLLFALHFYAYSYFFAYDEGVSAAPAWLKAVKDFVYLAFAVALFAIVPRRITRDEQLLFVPLGAALLLSSFVHAGHTGLAPQLWENVKNVVIFIPIYMAMFNLDHKTRRRLIGLFFAIIVFVAVTQSLFSIGYWVTGNRLWDGGLHVGLIGNPNSFAMLLNFAVAVALVMARRRGSVWLACLAMISLAAYTILGTSSGSQFLILLLLIAYSAVLSRRYWLTHLSAAALVALVAFSNQYYLDKTLHTVASIGDVLIGANDPTVAESTTEPGAPSKPTVDDPQISQTVEPDEPAVEQPPAAESVRPDQNAAEEKPVSQSVSFREKYIRLALGVLSKGLGTALLGDFDTDHFVPMDGQFWVFLFNGGLVTMLAFALPSAWVYLRTLRYVWRHPEDGQMLSLHVIITIFGITFLASRVLMYFPFNFLFFMVTGLAMAEIRHSTIRSPSGDRA